VIGDDDGSNVEEEPFKNKNLAGIDLDTLGILNNL
jgi:hypothetical protein